MKKYQVKAIFGPTIQGEGSAAGTVVKFLRLAGCNRWTGLPEHKPAAVCNFCDTDFRGGEPLTAAEIITRLDALGSCRRIVISGGEPTLQIDEPLLLELRKAGYWLNLETNGSRALGDLHRHFSHITMSPKQGMAETLLERCTDLKVLYPPIRPDITPATFEGFPSVHRYLQPVWRESADESTKQALEFMYANPVWRLSLQTHKILGVE